MKRRSIGFILTVLGLAFATPAVMAQTTVDDGAGTTTTTSTDDGAFESLSTGNRKITRALFDAQTQSMPPDDGTAQDGATDGTTGGTTTGDAGGAWTLDRIAAAKRDTGWGNVFKQMKADGLIQEKNLGQVIAKSNRPFQGEPAGEPGMTTPPDTTSTGGETGGDGDGAESATASAGATTSVAGRGPGKSHRRGATGAKAATQTPGAARQSGVITYGSGRRMTYGLGQNHKAQAKTFKGGARNTAASPGKGHGGKSGSYVVTGGGASTGGTAAGGPPAHANNGGVNAGVTSAHGGGAAGIVSGAGAGAGQNHGGGRGHAHGRNK